MKPCVLLVAALFALGACESRTVSDAGVDASGTDTNVIADTRVDPDSAADPDTGTDPIDAQADVTSQDAPVCPNAGEGGAPGTEAAAWSQLCAGFCERVRECGALCSVLSPPLANCTNDAPAAFDQCLNGSLDDSLLGVVGCPVECIESTFTSVTACQPTQCHADVLQVSCSGTGGILDVFRTPPPNCTWCQ